MSEKKKSQFDLDGRFTVMNYPAIRAFGVDGAFVLGRVLHWLKSNEEKGINYKDGKYWTWRNSYEEWQENDFFFMSVRKMRNIFSSLRKQGVLISDYHCDNKYKRSLWWTVDMDRLREILEEHNEDD